MQSKPNRQLGVSVAQAGRIRRDRRADRLGEPARGGLLAVPARDDPLGGAPGSSVHGGTVGFQTGLEYVNGKPKPLYFGWPRAADRVQARPRLLAVGPRAARRRRDEGDRARAAARARSATGTLKTVSHQQPRLLDAALLHAGRALARALGQPGGRQVRRPADRATSATRRGRRRGLAVAALALAGAAPPTMEAMPELPEVEITARLLDERAARREIESALAPGHQRAEDLRPAARRRSRASGSTRRAPARQAPDRRRPGELALLIHLMSAGRLQLYDKRAGPRDRTSRLLVRVRSRTRRRRGERAAPARVRLQAGGLGEAAARATSSSRTRRWRRSGPKRGPSRRRSASCSTRRGRCTRCCATST